LIKRARFFKDKARTTDGDMDGIIVRIDNTGDSSVAASDRYRHEIYHGLKRVPIGAQIIWKNKIVDMYVEAQNEQRIVLRFNTDYARVHVNIW